MTSPPAELLRTHRSEVDSVRRTAREIRRTLTIERHRLERIDSFMREWTLGTWRERYLEHPLLANIACRLIWEIFDDASGTPVGVDCTHRTLVDLEMHTVVPDPDARVRLWHPIRADASTIAKCRELLAKQHIVQAFPQANRRVLRPEPEERDHDATDRFARVTVYQHQLAAVCRHRGWRYRLMGAGFEAGSTSQATFELRSFDLIAELEVTSIEDANEMSPSGAWFLATTGELAFRRRDGARLRSSDVPPLVFSEIARDVSLIVSAALIEDADAEFPELAITER
jgi:hypothetical protein